MPAAAIAITVHPMGPVLRPEPSPAPRHRRSPSGGSGRASCRFDACSPVGSLVGDVIAALSLHSVDASARRVVTRIGTARIYWQGNDLAELHELAVEARIGCTI